MVKLVCPQYTRLSLYVQPLKVHAETKAFSLSEQRKVVAGFATVTEVLKPGLKTNQARNHLSSVRGRKGPLG